MGKYRLLTISSLRLVGLALPFRVDNKMIYLFAPNIYINCCQTMVKLCPFMCKKATKVSSIDMICNELFGSISHLTTFCLHMTKFCHGTACSCLLALESNLTGFVKEQNSVQHEPS